jgi:threonine dehydrogenase-like Zn-dependent dehydrogenase
VRVHALTWSPERRSRVETRMIDGPGSGDVVVELDFGGICGTDLDVVRGARLDQPGILGHEGTGRIVWSENNSYPVGARVVFSPVSLSNQDIVLGHTVEGVWQSRRRFARSEISDGHLVVCDEEVVPVLAPLAEPISIAIYALDIVEQLRSVRKLVIIGAGRIGLHIFLEARHRGIPDLQIVTTSRERAQWTTTSGLLDDREILLVPSTAAQVTEGVGGPAMTADAVFLCTSRSTSRTKLPLAMSMLRDEGVLDLVSGIPVEDGSGETDARWDAIRRANAMGLPPRAAATRISCDDGRNIFLTGHRGSARRHFELALQRLADHPEVFSKLVTHVVDLSDLPEVLEALARRKTPPALADHALKVHIDFRRWSDA